MATSKADSLARSLPSALMRLLTGQCIWVWACPDSGSVGSGSSEALMAEGKSWSPPGTPPFALLSLVVQILPVEDSGPAHEAGLLQGLTTDKEEPL